MKGIDIFDKIVIDGSEVSIADIDSNNGKYFLTAGQHTVNYFFKNKSVIPANLFNGIEEITNVSIPSTVSEIGDNAFSGTSLSEEAISYIIEINENAFVPVEPEPVKVDLDLKFSAEAIEFVEDVDDVIEPVLSATDVDITGFEFSYSSSNPEVVTVAADGQLTIHGVGQATITVAFEGNENYNAAVASYSVTIVAKEIEKQDVVMSLDKSEVIYQLDEENPVEPVLSVSVDNLPLTYESGNLDVATVDENGQLTLHNAGITTITIRFAGNDEYNPANVSYRLFVKTDIEMSFAEDTIECLDDSEIEFPALTTSVQGISVEYSSSDSNILAISQDENGVITTEIHSIGTVTVTATFNGTDIYNRASCSFNVIISQHVYTEEEAIVYNAALPDAVKAGDVAQEETLYDEASANAYNVQLDGAVKAGDVAQEEILYDEASANAHNAQLDGAVKAGDVAQEEVLYDETSANAYNAQLDGAVKAGDVAQEEVLYDEASANAYNAQLEGAVKAGDVAQEEVLYDEAAANAYNAQLEGAWQYGKVKTEGKEAIPEHYELNGKSYDEDPTYMYSLSYDYIHDEQSWQDSFEHGALHLYYEKYPQEDLWDTINHRAATYNNRHYTGTIDNEEVECNAEWASASAQKLVINENTYYAVIFSDTNPRECELFTNVELTTSANKIFNITSVTYPNCTQCWEGAINAAGAKFPWIAPHFENAEEGLASSIIFQYEGKDDVRPWRNAKIFGKGNGHKAWGIAAVSDEFKNNDFVNNPFDIAKFKLILINSVTGKETESNAYDYIYDENSWNQSYGNGVLKDYYITYPDEDLISTNPETPDKTATFNDRIYIGTIDNNETQVRYKAGWLEKSQSITNIDNSSEVYYMERLDKTSPYYGTADEWKAQYLQFHGRTWTLYTDAELTQEAGKVFNIETLEFDGFTHTYNAWLANGAKLPWIAPYFDTDENAILRFEYEGLDPAYPWGKDTLFGNGTGLKVWGAASVAEEFKDDSFIIPENSNNESSSFDINKFKLLLEYKGVEFVETIDAIPEVLYTDLEVNENNAQLSGAKHAGDVAQEEVLYDEASANAYNAGLSGAVKAGDVAQEEVLYDEASANAYNAGLSSAVKAGDVAQEEVLYDEASANAYNAQLEGAVKAGDPWKGDLPKLDDGDGTIEPGDGEDNVEQENPDDNI